MPSASNIETEKWKTKYYGVLDRFEKKESEWLKSEKLLSSALNRISIIAEGDNALVDHHLQALRVVLKEKFSLYRVESVLSELFNIVTKAEKKTAKKVDDKQLSIDVLLNLIDGIDLPKALQKKKNTLVKELKKNPDSAEQVVSEVKTLITASLEKSEETKSEGFFSKIFSKESQTDELELLADAIHSLHWPDSLKTDGEKLNKAIRSCHNQDEFNALLKQFNALTSKWQPNATAIAVTSVDKIKPVKQDDTGPVKLQYLGQFVAALKSQQPDYDRLQSIELSDSNSEAEPEQIAKAISRLINVSFASSKITSTEDNSIQPAIQEVFIQLLEHLVVPVSLLKKAEELRNYLEEDGNKEWRVTLKKVVQFVNEVRFQEYQEEGEYEDFLQQVTGRLQEMVQFI
ncbi:MAG: hypothetical protein KAU21_01030, partial [Gammaproteobacteria bacterium]|nr:hypothetical protein [Gammaproteobacteria bacterium]